MLPLVVEYTHQTKPVDALSNWVGTNRPWLDEKLLQHGALLFQGFAIDSPRKIEEFIKASGHTLRDYVEGQSQRQCVSEKIYTSTEYPAKYDITLHNELSYTRFPPQRLYFNCQVAPISGGETPIADCRRVYQHLDPLVRDTFERKNICYVKNMHGGKGLGKSWQEHFETDDPSAVERHLKEREVQFEWTAEGGLKTRQVRPAVIDHPATGEKIWFNQADLWHYSNLGDYGEDMLELLGEDGLATNAYFADGSQIAAEYLAMIRALAWEEASIFRWEQGDLLVLDNLLVSHGRRAFSGNRSILVAMS